MNPFFGKFGYMFFRRIFKAAKRKIPAMLTRQHDIMEIRTPFLLQGQIFMAEAGKPLCRPAIITVRIRADIRNDIFLGFNGQQAGCGIF